MPKTAAERTQTIETRKTLFEDPVRLWVHDGWRPFQVWRVPVEALVLNVDNRRFAAERLWAQEQLGRSLDPENYPDDERCIESLLLDKSHRVDGGQIMGTPSKDYESLKNDWRHRGQETPLWIRPDGTVRNGNRRLAMVQRLQREHGDAGLTWVNAVILDPVAIDESALLEMEQREQLTENFKVRYNDIDYLLALREAAEIREIDWFDQESIDEVAGKLQTTVEQSKAEVVRDLYAIKYMDQFLAYTNQEGQYHRLLRTLEMFRDIGRMMITIESDYPDDFDRVLRVLFATLLAEKSYQDVRRLRQMFRRDRPRFDRLAENISEAEARIQPETKPSLASPSETSADESEEDEEDSESRGGRPSVTNYPPAPAIGRMIDVAIDGYQASRQDDVLKVLREIVNRLESLGEDERLATAVGDAGSGAEARAALKQIIDWADQKRGLLDGDA